MYGNASHKLKSGWVGMYMTMPDKALRNEDAKGNDLKHDKQERNKDVKS